MNAALSIDVDVGGSGAARPAGNAAGPCWSCLICLKYSLVIVTLSIHLCCARHQASDHNGTHVCGSCQAGAYSACMYSPTFLAPVLQNLHLCSINLTGHRCPRTASASKAIFAVRHSRQYPPIRVRYTLNAVEAAWRPSQGYTNRFWKTSGAQTCWALDATAHACPEYQSKREAGVAARSG